MQFFDLPENINQTPAPKTGEHFHIQVADAGRGQLIVDVSYVDFETAVDAYARAASGLTRGAGHPDIAADVEHTVRETRSSAEDGASFVVTCSHGQFEIAFGACSEACGGGQSNN